MTATGVVIVAHRSRDDVLALLGDLGPGRPVVVVDAGSDDGTPDAVRAATAGRPVRLLELRNTGYARAANAGVRALPSGSEHALILNADVRLDAEAPELLGAALDADPRLGAVGPRVRYPSGAPQASARRIPGLGTALGHALLGWWWPANPATRAYRADPAGGPTTSTPTAAVPVDWVSGCAIAVRRAAFDAVGGFDPGYRLFVEDVDLCDRLAAARWTVGFVPGVTVTHRVGAATATRPLRSRLAHARGLERFLRQRLPAAAGPAVLLLRPALLGWALVVTLVGALRGERSSTGERRTPAAVGA